MHIEETSESVLYLQLPLPPTINQQYVTVGRRRVLSSTAKRYKQTVVKQLRRHYQSGRISYFWAEALRKGFLSLEMTFYFRTPLLRDLDSGLKIAQDALCEALHLNDNRVVELHLYKQVDRQKPRLDVIMTVRPEWDFQRPTSGHLEPTTLVIQDTSCRQRPLRRAKGRLSSV